MKNWIRFIVIFLLSFATLIGIIVFYQAGKPIAKAEETAEAKALSDGHLAEVSKSYLMNSDTPSITVLGKDKDGRAAAAFVPDGEKGEVTKVLLKDGISAKEALNVVKEDMKVKKVLHVHLGQAEPGPVWEVAFTGPDDELNYAYILFKDGTLWKKIMNL
ncbi:cell wall elongation regulator TseB-like domain-containing protein [Bhargavaea cecembensis]|uniref:cell wall elongation regulator TseB-like domain-containing protein n=1 Tax=Bhargavaea cecembensis TaxID=394098 RepID=UPI00058CD84B|nr:DUF5590 domain-containing protein [Bhargavaea cecembensis]